MSRGKSIEVSHNDVQLEALKDRLRRKLAVGELPGELSPDVINRYMKRVVDVSVELTDLALTKLALEVGGSEKDVGFLKEMRSALSEARYHQVDQMMEDWIQELEARNMVALTEEEMEQIRGGIEIEGQGLVTFRGTRKAVSNRRLPEATELAKAFISVIGESLTEEQMAELRKKNASLEDDSICESHCFLDANQAMITAFDMVGPRLELHDEAHHKLVGKAWGLAKEANFDTDNL